MKKWKSLAEKTLILTLSAAMAAGSVDISAFAAAIPESGMQEDGIQEVYEEESTDVTITGFASLSEEVCEQTLPAGADESGIVFPDTLTVTVEKGNPSVIREECTLEGITWKLDENKSDAPVFDGSADGSCYVYTPVLPQEDGEGDLLVTGTGVELPAIRVQVEECDMELLDGEDQQFLESAEEEEMMLQDPLFLAGEEGPLQIAVDGKTTCYASLKEALAAVDTAAQQAAGTLDVTLTLLENIANGEAVQWTLTSAGQQVNLTIDLNGHELGCYMGGEWKSERADFSLGVSGEKTKLTLMDSSSGGAGILHGALVATNGGELSVAKDYTAKTEALTVYWDSDYVTDFTRALEERKNNGEAISLYYRIWLPENEKISGAEISGLNQDAIDNGNLKCFNELLYVVYAYAVDHAGNRSSYICSNGIVIDTVAPDITIGSGDVTPTDKTAVCKAGSVSEDATVCYFVIETAEKELVQAVEALQSPMLYFASENNIFADYDASTGKWMPRTEYSLSYQGSDGNTKQVNIRVHAAPMQKGGTDNRFVLSGLKANTGYRLYASSIDLAGNLQAASVSADFTTQPTIPEVTVKPTLSGTYGTQAKDFRITGGTVVNPDDPGSGVLNGTWSFADTAAAGSVCPVPGTDQTYVLRFTPEAGTACSAVEVKVVPQVAKKELKIHIGAELEKIYGEPNPAFTCGNADWVTDLVTGDTKEEVVKSLSMVTQATAASPAGEYRFEVKSDSTKYEVKPQYVCADASVSQYGKLTIKKADAKLTAAVDNYDKCFGDKDFSLGVVADHAETAIRYAVTEGADVVSVAADGMVTIQKAGTAKIRVSLPESRNHNAAADKEITVTVSRKPAYTVPDLSRSYYYKNTYHDRVDTGALLPADCGKIMDYNIYAGEKVTNITLEKETGILTYTVDPWTLGKTGSIKAVVYTENYESIVVPIGLLWSDRQEVSVKAGTQVTLKSSTMTYGDSLSVLKFEKAEFVDTNGNPVTGTLAWEDGTAIPAAGTASANWKFTPDDEAYLTKTGSTGITVKRAKPYIETAPTAAKITCGSTLEASALTGGKAVYGDGKGNAATLPGGNTVVEGSFTWKQPELKPAVSDSQNTEYAVVFRPADTVNYETAEVKVKLTVEKTPDDKTSDEKAPDDKTPDVPETPKDTGNISVSITEPAPEHGGTETIYAITKQEDGIDAGDNRKQKEAQLSLVDVLEKEETVPSDQLEILPEPAGEEQPPVQNEEEKESGEEDRKDSGKEEAGQSETKEDHTGNKVRPSDVIAVTAVSAAGLTAATVAGKIRRRKWKRRKK